MCKMSPLSLPWAKHVALLMISVFPSFLIDSLLAYMQKHTPQTETAGRQVKRNASAFSPWHGEMLRADEVEEMESRGGRDRQPRKKSRTSNSASLCSYTGKFPLQTLMYNHMPNPLIR